LGQKIAQTTGGTNKAAYCAPLTRGGFDARVLTEVNALPELELAVFGFRVVEYKYPGRTGPANKSYSVIDDDSTYLHVADCLAVLPKYEQYFRNQTGLIPISSQCAAIGGGYYVPQVDAIGVGVQHLFETSIDIGSGNSSEASQLDVANYLQTIGATPTNSARPGTFIQIKYFAAQEVYLLAYDFAHKNNFTTEAECLEAVNAVQPVLSQRGELNLVSLRCGKGQWPTSKTSSSMVAIFDFTGSSQTNTGLKVYTYGQFSSHSECRAKMASTENSYCATDIDIYRNFHGYSLNVIH
jgi:hypothetical protein